MLLASIANFSRSSGMVTNGQGMTGDPGVAVIVLTLLLGAFAGLLLGLLAHRLLRFASMFTGHEVGGPGWSIAGGAVAGAALSALLVFTGGTP